MSVNCVAKFNDPNTTIRFLQSNTPYSGNIADRFDGAFFRFEMVENETIIFTLRLTPQTAQPINVAFTLYRRDGEVFTNLGTSISDEFYNTFDYDATPAEYYVCITSDWDMDYTLEADFTDYPYILITDAIAYAGAGMKPTEFAKLESICDSPVFYQLIAGELPAGLEFGADGVIFGTPTEQDCEPATNDMPPSFTWWDEDAETKTRTSYGVDHHITVRAALVDDPDTYHDRDFMICIHNNWDYDRDHFMAQRESWEREVFLHEDDVKPVDLNPPEPEQPLELTTLCEPCPVEIPQAATLQELKELAKMVVINPEYQGLVKINNEGLCEVCEDDDNTETHDNASIDTVQFKVNLCEPCPEPIVIDALIAIPPTLCPVSVQQIEVKEKPRLVRGIPMNCYPDLLDKLFGEKVCKERSFCPSSPIYPQPKAPESNKLQSECPPCEE